MRRGSIVDRIHEVSIDCDFALDGCDFRPRQDITVPTDFDAKVFADAKRAAQRIESSITAFCHHSRENRGLLGVLIVDVSDKTAADRADGSEAAIGDRS